VSRPSLEDRLAALDEVAALGADILSAEVDAAIGRVRAGAAERRRRSAEHTVVGLFGATGSGKSSLLNALVGAELAAVHVRRPTTTAPLAALWHPEGAADLLDWLGVADRVVLEAPIEPRAGSLILIDLPDFDSVAAEHRAIATRLAGQVDAMIWVVDPQKYADAVLHADFIRPHARHGAVTLVVLNQADRLAPGEAELVRAHLARLVEADGLRPSAVLAVSAATGEGLPALRRAIGAIAADRAAAVARIAADLDGLAESIPPATVRAGASTGGGVAARPPAPERAAAALAAAVAVAAGTGTVAEAVAASYRRRAGRIAGWPPLAWIGALRPDPLRRLGLGAGRGSADPQLRRTSLPAPGAAGAARQAIAVREYVAAATAGLAEPWRVPAREGGESAIARFGAAVDLAIASTPLPVRRGWWWPIPAIIQWVALAAALVGAGWLLLAAFGASLPIPRIEVPSVEGWPVPTLLIVAGVLLGLLVALASGAIAAAVAAWRRRGVSIALTAAVRSVTDELVVAPVAAVVDRARRFDAAAARLARERR